MLREVPKFSECLFSFFYFIGRDVPVVAPPPRWKACTLLAILVPEFLKFYCTAVA